MLSMDKKDIYLSKIQVYIHTIQFFHIIPVNLD